MMRRVYAAISLTFFIIILSSAFLIRSSYRGFSAQIVLTSSMQPAIPAGSVVITRSLPTNQYVVGDVISYSLKDGNGTEITHRITQLSYGSDGTEVFTTKGDANSNGDLGKVEPDQVKGRVIEVIPLLGYIFSLEHTPGGFLLVCGITFLFLVLVEFYHVMTYIQNALSTLRSHFKKV